MWKIPSESAQHCRTWLAWPWDGNIWDRIPGTGLKACQDAIDRLVRAMLNYENVALVVRETDARQLERRFEPSCARDHQLEIFVADYNDIWARDTLPTFARNTSGTLAAVNWNFNGWGRRVRPYASYGADAKLCKTVAALAGAELVDSGIVAEGGAFAFDEDQLIVATKSVLFDRFRNPGSTKAELEEAIRRATGRRSICWLPGDRNEPITSGHADSLIAFAGRRNVLMNWRADEMSPDFDVYDYNIRVFEAWSNREMRDFDVIRLPAARYPGGYNCCSSYINFVHVNGALIVPEFGDPEGDDCARAIIAEAFEDRRDIESVDMRAIAAAGGSIHCITQQQPLLDRRSGISL
ncbi:agmatine deiminase family protein [Bradyrhizobium sp. USDA 4469]